MRVWIAFREEYGIVIPDPVLNGGEPSSIMQVLSRRGNDIF
jgi:hypothetical protein